MEEKEDKIHKNKAPRVRTGGTSRVLSDVEVMLCGSVAGTVSRTVLNPLDVIKIRLQIQQESVSFATADLLKTVKPQVKYHGTLGAFRTILIEEGARVSDIDMSHIYIYIYICPYGTGTTDI